MGLANLRRNNKEALDAILAKTKKVSKVTSSRKSGSVYEKVKEICNLVEKKLGHLRDSQILIRTEEELHAYITKAIENGYISLDTETDGLDCFCDNIVGACIYTPGEKTAYVPINHVSLISGARLNNQLTNEQVRKEFQRLLDNKVKIIYFNAKFDIRVMRHQLGINLPPYWDGFIAGKILKENEEEANLKYLWTKYCSGNKEAEHFTFDKLFKGYKFSLFPIETACLYAANDAIITWELFKFQEPFLTETDPKCIECGFQKLAYVYNKIEMPIVEAIADIEDNGVALNIPYIKELSKKYHTLQEEKIENFNKAIETYQNKITAWKSIHPESKLEDPINIGSAIQLAELFYDILELPPVSRKQPRGTGEDILNKLNHPLCKPILDYREVTKLITTYIDKMPNILNKKTGRLHCTFKQCGADCVSGDTIIPNLEYPGHTIEEICETNLPNMLSGIFYPLKITIFNRYGELEQTSECIKFKNENAIKLTFSDESTICGTYNHPILMGNNIFKELKYIEVGDIIQGTENTLEVIKKEYLKGITVYDFKVPNTHSFYSNKVISHNTGRFACIAAGTKISMPGGDKNIEDVKPGDYVYSYDDSGKLKICKVKSSIFTGSKQCIKLNWFSKYNKFLTGSLICTPDHYIKTTKGWVKAKDILTEHSIYHVHRKETPDHVRLSANFGQGAEEEHVWIRDNFFKVKKGLCIHHKDCNRLNNSPDNLQICSRKEHINIHRKMKNGYCGAYDFTREELIAKCKSVNWQITALPYDAGSLKGWLKEHKINYIDEYTKSYESRPTIIKSNGVKFKYKCLPLVKDNLCYALDLADNDILKASSYFGVSQDTFIYACNRFKLLDNHKISNIEVLEGYYPVYDLEIEDTHNFIANELCVHNSSDPNLQNIPSHNREIRRIFTSTTSINLNIINNQIELYKYDLVPTTRGEVFSQDLVVGDELLSINNKYTIQTHSIENNKVNISLNKYNSTSDKLKVKRQYILIGSDFSQQEPKLTADLSNDEKFIKECAAGKDAYGTVASLAYNKPYEDCLEFYLDENGKKTDKINHEGKKRRSEAKSILLGICYGRSIETIAEQLKCDRDKAQQIYDSVLRGLPGLKRLMEESQEMARRYGWVETRWGRRRHIPDMQLEPYEITSVGTKNFDPFFDSEELGVVDDTERLKQQYLNQISIAKWFKEKQKIKEQAEKDGFKIKDNTKFIEDATRQCVNSRIQGSAADQSKIAIQNIYKDQEMKELGWRTLLLVHDEVIGECPLINAKRCGELLVKNMLDSSKDLRTGAACDATYVFSWYDDQFDEDVPIEKMTQEEIEQLVKDKILN